MGHPVDCSTAFQHLMHGAPPDLFPTEATAGLRRKNAHFVNLESLLGGVAIAPRYPAPATAAAGNTGT